MLLAPEKHEEKLQNDARTYAYEECKIYIYILTETETKKHALKAQAVSPENKVICWYDQSYSTFIIERAL